MNDITAQGQALDVCQTGCPQKCELPDAEHGRKVTTKFGLPPIPEHTPAIVIIYSKLRVLQPSLH